MSWLSELNWSNRLEHLYAMIAGEAELDETVPSTYDRKQGFLYKIAQKIQGGSLPDASEASEGDVLTIDDGEPVWAAGGGSGGGAVYATFTEDNGTWSCDKTYAELKTAYDSGCVIIGDIDGENDPFILINYDGKEGAEFGGSSTIYQASINYLFYYRAYIRELNNTAFAEYGSVSVG